MTLSRLLHLLAVVLLALATLVALSDASVAHEAALLPAGLACWAASTAVG